ncbi:PREDICTED: fringe glycosyltransferase-like, partial [Nicrophorus vespilloides]|uniref:Fringe glycosyltransferase-like n=1 Tax=Nicrophorus vespilloides TaxID=110193 RepID=A0ABM1N604_NICVS
MSEYGDVGGKEKMSPKLRRFLQTLLVVILACYTTLLAYQSLSRVGTPSVRIAEDAAASEKLIKDYNSNNNNYLPLVRADDGIPRDPDFTSEIPSATATVKPPTTTLEDLFISVKTTKHYHQSRLLIILKTWFQLAKAQTWFFTDSEDPEFQKKTNGHMINTNCSSSHSRKALCCKMSVEFDTFIESNK